MDNRPPNPCSFLLKNDAATFLLKLTVWEINR
jgi:hypothetical protein